jgi:hypothetical protein
MHRLCMGPVSLRETITRELPRGVAEKKEKIRCHGPRLLSASRREEHGIY